jgi:hypothetical protein
MKVSFDAHFDQQLIMETEADEKLLVFDPAARETKVNPGRRSTVHTALIGKRGIRPNIVLRQRGINAEATRETDHTAMSIDVHLLAVGRHVGS